MSAVRVRSGLSGSRHIRARNLQEYRVARSTGRVLGRKRAKMGTSFSTVASAKTLGDFEASNIDGKLTKLSQYLGKVVLVVNVASK